MFDVTMDTDWYWRIGDGRVWSAPAGEFVQPPAEAAVIDLPGASGPANVQDLIDNINYYRGLGYTFPLGELAGPDGLAKQFEEAVARRLDAFALERQYDNMDKARLASLTVDFKADGDYANQVYDQVWIAAFALEDQIKAGALTVDDAIAQLPALSWDSAA